MVPTILIPNYPKSAREKGSDVEWVPNSNGRDLSPNHSKTDLKKSGFQRIPDFEWSDFGIHCTILNHVKNE